MAALKAGVGVGVTIVANSNKVSSFAKTVYDFVSSIISGISTKTVIKNVEATYTYNAKSFATFKYIKKKGEPDSRQVCSHISTRCEINVATSIPTLECVGGSYRPNISQKLDRILARPDGYNDNLAAMDAYLESRQIHAYLGGVDLYGLEGRKLVKVGDCRPDFLVYLIE